MKDPLAYQRSIWGYDWRLQAEHTPKAIAGTLSAYGISVYALELWYGTRSQGDIDGLSPRTEAEFLTLRDQFAALGIALIPVVLPRQEFNEVAVHASIARACGSVVVDIEGGPEYWSGALESVQFYAAALRQAAPDACIIWQPDGRLIDAGRADGIQVIDQCNPYVDAYAPQLYAGWPVYGQSAWAVTKDLGRYNEFVRRTGRPVYPTLWISDAPADPANLAAGCIAAGATGVMGFRLGAAGDAGLTVLRDAPIPAGPIPEPAPEPEPAPDGGLSPEWTLRVGLAEQLSRAVVTLLDAETPGAEALVLVREWTRSATDTIDAAGGELPV